MGLGPVVLVTGAVAWAAFCGKNILCHILLLKLNTAYIGLCKFMNIFKAQQTQSPRNEHAAQNWWVPTLTQLCKMKFQISYGGKGWGIKGKKILGKPV